MEIVELRISEKIARNQAVNEKNCPAVIGSDETITQLDFVASMLKLDATSTAGEASNALNFWYERRTRHSSHSQTDVLNHFQSRNLAASNFGSMICS